MTHQEKAQEEYGFQETSCNRVTATKPTYPYFGASSGQPTSRDASSQTKIPKAPSQTQTWSWPGASSTLKQLHKHLTFVSAPLSAKVII